MKIKIIKSNFPQWTKPGDIYQVIHKGKDYLDQWYYTTIDDNGQIKNIPANYCVIVE